MSLNLTILMLILALLEGGLTVQEWVRVASSTYEIEYSDNYVGFDPVLGTVANQSGTARLKIRDQILYDVHYTLNDQGLRVTPEPNQPDALVEFDSLPMSVASPANGPNKNLGIQLRFHSKKGSCRPCVGTSKAVG